MIGTPLGHYRIVEKIGDGGMGVVYKAEDMTLGRFVALKFLPADVLNSPATTERFLREARAAAGLSHPNICLVYEIGIHEGQHFLALRERVIGGLAILAGMRPGEIFALRRSHLEDGYVDITQRTYRGKLDTPKTFNSRRWAAFGSGLSSWIGNGWQHFLREGRNHGYSLPKDSRLPF